MSKEFFDNLLGKQKVGASEEDKSQLRTILDKDKALKDAAAKKAGENTSSAQQERARKQAEEKARQDAAAKKAGENTSSAQQERARKQAEEKARQDAAAKSSQTSTNNQNKNSSSSITTSSSSTKTSTSIAVKTATVVSGATLLKGTSKKSGVNKKVAKQVYKNVQKDLQDLEKYMNKLVEDVQKMNELCWYGDKLANTWYDKICGHYSKNKGMNLVKFYTGVSNFQASLKTVFQKANINKISF